MPADSRISAVEFGGVETTERAPENGLRHVRNRNSKNLFLSIDNSTKQRAEELNTTGCDPQAPQPPLLQLQDACSIGGRKHARSEAHIFSLSNVLNSSAASAGNHEPKSVVNRLKRGMSLPLQLKTPFAPHNNSDSIGVPSMAWESSPIEAQRLSLESVSERGLRQTVNSKSWARHRTTRSFTSSLNDNGGPYGYGEGCNTSNAYPNGPLLVYGSFLYLCSEPSLKEVESFDVTLNVAQEITDLRLHLPLAKQDSYHHIDWIHTSKICADLPRLTQIIHQAVECKQTVLVHCQCGVSRSASLIVAYIMRYEILPLHDAYNKLKSVAKDISPNMSLIFQLMEWGEMLTTQKKADSQPAQNAPEVDAYNRPDLAPLEISKIISHQDSQDLTKGTSASPDCSNISAENTPCTPNEFFDCDRIPFNSSGTAKDPNSTGHLLSGPTEYSCIFDSYATSAVENCNKPHVGWD
ncbi:LAME_0D05556g1_1 [Lachancea meyersii CBS 8951]|uniref:protein-tyrosine-phosphatase n=1 Tax=Lachancea meyersii CBS 8951 TaxID=1266667 RepID=A0A1G4J8S6_9SACH|nr:LAME_0D05556g1_1 [Lachancea meyersii CBS 8951]